MISRPALIIAGSAIAGLALGFFGARAWGAEREHAGPHEITIFLDNYQPDRPNIFTISQAYEDWDKCEKKRALIVVKVRGGHSVCTAVETRRVR